MQFTDQQLQDYRDYERVRKGGRYNMFDPRARQAAGLTGDEYGFVMKHFSELREAAEAAGEKPSNRKRKSANETELSHRSGSGTWLGLK